MSNKFTEEMLAEILVDFLEIEGWEVYQEVKTFWGRIDIVAVKGPIKWAIECKLSFGFSVLEQAHKAIGKFHYVSVAVPYRAHNHFANKIAKMYGIGVLVVSKSGWRNLHESAKPRLFRKPKATPTLYEEQKTYCKAGSNKGGHWTPFKGTRERLLNIVHNRPGIPFQEALKKLDHHYSSLASAKSCIKNLIGTEALPELRLTYVDNTLCIFLDE